MSRKLKPRPTVPLPDRYWISPSEFRTALGFSRHWWKRVELPVMLDYFTPVALGTDLPSDYRWCLDDIAVRMPHLVSHLAPGTFLDRFKQSQRTEREAYLASKKSTAKQLAA